MLRWLLSILVVVGVMGCSEAPLTEDNGTAEESIDQHSSFGRGHRDRHRNHHDRKELTPFVSCVAKVDDHSFLAVFGYDNDSHRDIRVPIGSHNKFSPAPMNRGQPEVFEPGRHPRLFSVPFDRGPLSWKLGQRRATADRHSRPCPSNDPNGNVDAQNSVVHGPFVLTSAAVLDPTPPRLNDEELGAEDEDALSPGRPGPLQAGQGEEASPLEQTPLPALALEATGNFGNFGAGYGYPSDAMIGASTTHVAVAGASIAAFYQRQKRVVVGGVEQIVPIDQVVGVPGEEVAPLFLASRSVWDMIAPLGLTFPGMSFNDPRLIFDGFRRRFFWLAAFNTTDVNTPYVVTLAVSQTEDPTDGFFVYWWPGDPTSARQAADSGDYPSVGIVQVQEPGNVVRGYFLETHFVVNASRRYMFLTMLNADQLASGIAPVNPPVWTSIKNPDGSPMTLVLMPSMHHSAANQGFLGSLGTDGQSLLIWQLNTFNRSLSAFSMPVEPFVGPVNGTQAGDPANCGSSGNSPCLIAFTNLGNDVLKAVYRDGFVYMVTQDTRTWGTADNTPFTSVKLFRVELSNLFGPNFVDRTFGSANVFEDPADAHFHYGWPSVEVNDDGTMVVVYTRTGAWPSKSVFPEARFSVREAADADMRPSRVLVPGTSAYVVDQAAGISRWGDLAGASIDPIDGNGVWLANEVAFSNGSPNGRYGIGIGKVLGEPLGCYPQPTCP